MKSMNRRESKKIAVMAAVVMGFMVIAFMPAASATVTSFTVTPSTGIAGAVDSYNALVTTDGVTTINITIPPGFLAVEPVMGGVEIARVDFWNESTKAYYGYATITSNIANPTTLVDIYCKFGGDAITTTQAVSYYPGASSMFGSGFGSDTSSVIIKLPTETLEGSIKIAIDCTAFQLDDVMIAIKQFVRNPRTAGDYVFSAEGVDETVQIGERKGYGAVYRAGQWFIDTTGNQVTDIWFWYGALGETPLVGDIDQDGTDDIATYKNGFWQVNTNGDHETVNLWFWYGATGWTPLVGDIDQDGTDDIAAYKNGIWLVNTNGDHETVNRWFWYGAPGWTPLVGDINQDGTDDIAVYINGLWLVSTDGNPDTINLWFWYGAAGLTPLVGDINKDGTDDIAVYINGLWLVSTDGNPDTINLWFWYGAAGYIPLTGDIK